MMLQRTILAGAAIAILSLGAAGADDTPLTLARVYKEGDVVRHRVEIAANMMGNDVTAIRTIKTTVKEIKKTNGDIIVLSADQGGKVVVGGQEQDIPPQTDAILTLDKTGKIVKYERGAAEAGLMAPEIEHLMAILNEPRLSDKAVKPGDTWTVELVNPAVKGRKITPKLTFVAVETVETVTLWKVKQLVTADTDDQGGKAVFEFTFWLRPADGVIAKAEGSIKDLPTSYGPVTVQMKMTLLKPEPDDKGKGA
ncbi:MAG: hypothetical protein NT029_15865 [Armatimonadetes bacterium]|nr:hypothetical protein [Armatimonadota bacterium]